jgi:hypothetical protein
VSSGDGSGLLGVMYTQLAGSHVHAVLPLSSVFTHFFGFRSHKLVITMISIGKATGHEHKKIKRLRTGIPASFFQDNRIVTVPAS